MLTRLGRLCVLLLITCLAATALAAVAGVVDPTTDPTGAVQGVIDALRSHNYILAFALAVAATVALLRWAAPKVHGPFGVWLNKSRVSAALALLSGTVAAIIAALVAGVHFSVDVVIAGLKTGILAIGGYNAFWDLFFPRDTQPATEPKMVQIAPSKTAAILLPFLLLGMVSGCGTPGAQALKTCEMGKLPQTIQAIVAEVSTILASGGATWQHDLEELGKQLGPGQLQCIIAAIMGGNAGFAATPGTPSNTWAKQHPEAATRAQTYLATHKGS